LKITREVKTAILVIASILLFVWGYSFLKGKDLFSDYTTFYVQYDNVEGLAGSAPVTLNGLVIGKVTKITIEQGTGKLLVELQVKTDFSISKSSEVNIYEPGFIGGKQVQIIPNLEDKSVAVSGDYLKGRIVPGLASLVGEKLTPLQQKVEKMIVSADTLLNNLNKVLDAKTRQNLKASIANLNETLAEIKGASGKVNTMLAQNSSKISSTVSNLDNASANFSKISDSLAKADIGKTVKKLENTLANVNKIVADMNDGKGSMGKLLKDDALYTNFTKSSKELELLLQDLRLNPTRYINVSLFGKKNKPYVAPVLNDTVGTSKK